MRRQIQAKHQQLVVDLPDSLPKVWADADRLTQVLTNRVVHAHHYTPEGGSIAVRGTASDDLSWVAVSDTGVGMSAEETVHLFTTLYRVRNQRTEAVQGSGLGLTISRSLVELQHGAISLQSMPGAGSIFTVTLPVNDSV